MGGLSSLIVFLPSEYVGWGFYVELVVAVMEGRMGDTGEQMSLAQRFEA